MAGFLVGVLGAVAVVCIVTLTEFVAPRERYSIGSRLRGILFGAVTVGAGGLTVAGLQRAWAAVRLNPIAIIPVRGAVGDALAIILAVAFLDFLAYWSHRFHHRFLWRVHLLHHCQTELHAANGYAHFSERGFRFLLFALPLSLIRLDFPPLAWPIIGALLLLESYIHSPTTAHLGPLGKVLVDNRFHRIHHSLDQRHFDRNFGIALSVWDRLFGTAWEPVADEWPATGVAGVAPPRSIREYLLFPFLRLDQREGEALPPLRRLRS